jgi:multicopper oxidase
MRAPIRPVATAAASLAIVASLLGTAVVDARPASTAGAAADRAARTGQAILPVATCTPAGPTTSCHLWARTGTTNLSGEAALPIFGYAATAVATIDRPGGPAIVVAAGQTVNITVHNDLAEATALALPGQTRTVVLPAVPGTDTSGISPGSSKTYSFVADRPGTFLYGAGLVAGGPGQVAMGLYGALVVRPAAGQAYDADSSFDQEFPVVVAGIDPALNRHPAGFDMSEFAPSYWVINGRSYRDIEDFEIGAPPPAGTKVLLRYVNAGLAPESLGILGQHERIYGADGERLTHPYDAVAETVPPGGTLDAIVTIPSGTPNGTRFAIGSAAGHMFNGTSAASTGALSFGGMLTFLTVAAYGGGAVDGVAPSVVDQLAVSIAAGGMRYRVTATADDSTSGGSLIAAAEWFEGVDPGAGNGHVFAAADGAFDGSSEALAATVDTTGWTAGVHKLSVRARDAAGNWSSVATLSVTAPDVLFRSGFESGDLADWSATRAADRLKVVAAAALNGTRGLRVMLAGAIQAYVIDTSPNSQTAYRARFLFNPRTSRTAGAAVDLFAGRTAAGTTIFRIQYRRTAGGAIQLRAVARVAAGQRAGAWVTISNRSHAIEMSWRAAAQGRLTLIVDGRTRGIVAGNTRGFRVDEVRLGATGGLVARTSGRFDLDRFSSSRGGTLVP